MKMGSKVWKFNEELFVVGSLNVAVVWKGSVQENENVHKSRKTSVCPLVSRKPVGICDSHEVARTDFLRFRTKDCLTFSTFHFRFIVKHFLVRGPVSRTLTPIHYSHITVTCNE